MNSCALYVTRGSHGGSPIESFDTASSTTHTVTHTQHAAAHAHTAHTNTIARCNVPHTYVRCRFVSEPGAHVFHCLSISVSHQRVCGCAVLRLCSCVCVCVCRVCTCNCCCVHTLDALSPSDVHASIRSACAWLRPFLFCCTCLSASRRRHGAGGGGVSGPGCRPGRRGLGIARGGAQTGEGDRGRHCRWAAHQHPARCTWRSSRQDRRRESRRSEGAGAAAGVLQDIAHTVTLSHTHTLAKDLCMHVLCFFVVCIVCPYIHPGNSSTRAPSLASRPRRGPPRIRRPPRRAPPRMEGISRRPPCRRPPR